MKRYEFIGSQPLILDNGQRITGGEFRAQFTDSYEAFLVRAGIVRPLAEPKSVPATPDEKKKG